MGISCAALHFKYILFVVFCLEDFATTVKTIWADMVTQMRFTGSWLDTQLRSNQEIM